MVDSSCRGDSVDRMKLDVPIGLTVAVVWAALQGCSDATTAVGADAALSDRTQDLGQDLGGAEVPSDLGADRAVDVQGFDAPSDDGVDVPEQRPDVPEDAAGDVSGDASGDAPDGGRMPIEHIIIVVKENHTFDNFFGSFPGAEGTRTAMTSRGAVTVSRPPLLLTRDLCHTHECALRDWNHGAMNGWDTGDPRNASDDLAYRQYTEADIPNYWQYARHFVLADHFFSGMLGPSFPGHFFTLAAQAGWSIGNPTQLVPWGCDDARGTTVTVLDRGTCMTRDAFPCFDFPTIPDLLPRELSWKFYGSPEPPLVGPIWTMFDAVDHIRHGPQWSTNVVNADEFESDITHHRLANVVWLVDQDLADEHPPLSICTGENWTVSHLNVLMRSEYWATSAVLITWDDFGGWYDHVPPPRQYGCDSANPYGLGFRLPLMILSPWARPGFILRSNAHHGSIARFIERVFHLGSLHDRDPAAQDGPDTNDLFEAFDFTQTPNAPLPLTTRSCLLQR